MYRKCRFIRKVVHYVLILSLLLTAITPGFSPMEVLAEGEPVSTESVFYVDGVNGSDEANGLSAATAFKTLAKAYESVPENNTETTIVICGNVILHDGAEFVYGNNSSGTYQEYPDYYRFPVHTGKVVITSVYGTEDYRDTAAINFDNVNYFFLGDTTFENISISGKADRLYANYYPLHLGKEISVGNDGFARVIYMGTSGKLNGAEGNGNKTPVSIADTSFTMESGVVDTVYGGGDYNQGSVARGKDNKVTVTINGGTVTNLYGSGVGNTDNAHHKSVEIVVNGGKVTNLYGAHGDATVYNDVSVNVNGGSVGTLYGACKYTGTGGNEKYTPHIEGDVTVTVTGGNITNLYAKQDGANVAGRKIVEYKNVTDVTMSTAMGFDTLKLTNASVTIPAGMEALWSNITQLQMTDNSSLTLGFVPNTPAQKVGVTFTKSGDTWNAENAVITAPSGTGDIFKVISPLNVLLQYDATGVSWTLKEGDISIGDKGTQGEELKIDLGLPEDGSYTTIPEDATLYEAYLQKVEDLGEAKEEVNVIAPIEVKGEIEIYVSPDGDDGNSGSINAPLKTISKAMEYVADLQEDGQVQGIVVYLRAGTYVVSETIALNEKHSGKNNIPVFISAYNDEEVVLSGAMNIAGQEFKSAQTVNTAVYNRLQEAVRDQIVAVDLKELGITKFGQIITGQQGAGGAQYQVYVNGEEFTLARYPNNSTLALRGKILDIGRIIYGYGDWPAGTNSDSTGIEFEMIDKRPTTWYDDGNIWLYGSMYAEWHVEDLRVAEIREKSIKLDHGSYLGAKASATNTYYYYNVLEELDVPGEFYLDNTNGILYLYPTGDMSNATVNYTLLDGNLFDLDGTKNLILNGLTFDTISAVAVSMSNCEQTIVQNCTIHNVGKGVVIDGKKNGVIYTDIYNFNERGVDFKTAEVAFDFTKALNFVQNCYIYNSSETKVHPIYLRGTGNVLSHNLIQNSYTNGINVNRAKECIIEYNEIVGGPTSVKDAAAIYQAGDPSNGGNHYRYNYIHDISNFSNSYNPSSIYIDEGLSGSYIYGNIMRNVPCGFYTNSGNNHVIVNNVVMDGRAGTRAGIRFEDNFKDYTITERFARASTLNENYETYFSMSADKRAEVKGRYPLEAAYYEELKTVIEANGMTYKGFYVCHGSYVADNLLYDMGSSPIGSKNDSDEERILGNQEIMSSNVIANEDPFVDAANHNYQLKDTGLITWQIVSMDKVGITREKKGLSSLELRVPSQGQAVAPEEVLFRWTFAEGADTYTLTLATNEALTENVKEVVLEKTSTTLENLEIDTTYYWKVTANTVSESRIATPVSTAVASFKTLSENTSTEPDDEKPGDEEVFGNIQHITFKGLGADYWSDPQYYVDANFDDSNELKLSLRTDLAANIDRGELVYGLGLGTREILHFQYKLDTLVDWNGFFLAQSNTDVWGTKAAETDAYFICIKPDQFELQKRKDGSNVSKNLGDEAVVVNNREIFDGGEWYDITCGAINNEDGSVRIIFMVNDTVVFDYVDKENAIVGETGFGVLVPKGNKNGIAHIKNLDVTDTSELEKLITEAETFATQIKEESNGGQYYDGTTKALQDAIAKAEAVVGQMKMPTQDEVDAEVTKLEAAIYAAEVSRNVQHITFKGLGAEHWSDPQYYVDANFDDSNELKLSLRTDLAANIDRGELVYGLGLGTREILHFQYKLDTLEDWNGFFLAQSNTDVWGTKAAETDAYFICIKPDQFELQKRKDGSNVSKNLGDEAVVVNNREIFDGGEWYDITCGAINNEDGSVRIIFKVNDTVVFDYVDKENAIVGATGFGVLVPKGNKNGIAHIKNSDITDTSELEKLITEAETFATQIKEESNGGQYYDGTTKALQDAIAKAEAVVGQMIMPTQDEVDAEVAKLEAAIYAAKASCDVQDITFEGLGANHWSDPQYYVDANFDDSNELKLSLRTDLAANIDRGELVYGLGLGTREILHFQYKLDTLVDWNGFFLAQSNTDVWGTKAAETDAYFICIKPDQFELQKRKDGKSLGNQAVVQNNSIIFDGGEWYDITCGAINNEDGSVRIIFKVNDKVVFDYVDKENAIVGETGFGVLVPKGNNNGIAHIKKAELTEPTPTSAPTAAPTSAPTAAPTSAPTAAPTAAPTSAPTAAPTSAPVDVTITEVKASEAVVEAVKENVTVAGGTATVDKTAVEAVVKATKENEAVVLPLTEVTAETVNKAEISAEALNAVAEKQADVVVEFSEITVKLDAEAVEAITEQAQGATIEIRAVKTEVNTLTEAQKTALESKEVAIVVTAQVFSDGEYIGDFKEGKATVMIPFTPDSGKEAEHYKVYYIDEAGVLKEVAAEYVSGYMVFTTPHFSDYVIVYEGAMGEDTTPTPSPEDGNDSDDSNDNDNSETVADTTSTTTTPGTGDDSNIFIWMALLAAAVVSCGLLIKKRIKK